MNTILLFFLLVGMVSWIEGNISQMIVVDNAERTELDLKHDDMGMLCCSQMFHFL